MSEQSRRTFLADVGRGMLITSLGSSLVCDLGLAPALAGEEPKTISFGELEPLVVFLQETPSSKLLPSLVEKLTKGLDLRQLTAAAAFANARTFGGENYFGFHVFMALAPAYQMAQELPKEQQPLPILKVLYRNAHYTQQVGGRAKEVLHPVEPAELPKDGSGAEQLREAVNQGDRAKADRILAALAKQSPEDAFNGLLLGVEDNNDVHSVVLPWRAWAMLDLIGKDHALTLLRQSVHKCAKQSAETKGRSSPDSTRVLVPKLLDKHRLLKNFLGTRKAEDAWVEKMSETIMTSRVDQVAEAVAAALAEGMLPEHIGEAISLAANQLVLRQVEKVAGRTLGQRVHGDSLGVHASDATNAWRNIIRVSNARNRAAGLIVAAMDVASSYQWGGSKELLKKPYPSAEQVDAIKSSKPEDLLRDIDGAIRENDQLRACALAQRYGQIDGDVKPLLNLLLKYSVSEDGRLHAEKYYRTVVEEFTSTRPAFRWRQMVALARVTASAYGYSQSDRKEGRAPGYEEACKLLKV